jgi:hypothetical protein
MSSGKKYVVLVDCGRFVETLDEAVAVAGSRNSLRRAVIAEVVAYTDDDRCVVFGVPA